MKNNINSKTKNRISDRVVGLFAIAMSSLPVQGFAQRDLATNDLLVQIKPDSIRSGLAFRSFLKSFGAKRVELLNTNSQARSSTTPQWIRLELSTVQEKNSVFAALKNHPAVLKVQPNWILSIPERSKRFDSKEFVSPVETNLFSGTFFENFGSEPIDWQEPRQPSATAPRPTIPGVPTPGPELADPYLKVLYGIQKTETDKAWAQHKGTADFIVADIDTGTDYTHPDLIQNLWRNPNPTLNDPIGFDYIHNDGLPFDDQGHGTHTAGTIGAVGNNGVGLSGINHKVAIMTLKFLSAEGQGTTANAVKSIDYAVQNGAKVINASWGGPGDEENPILEESIRRAEAAGVLFIAAAGNESSDNDNPAEASYPAAFHLENLISVAATDRNDAITNFSNYGKKSVHVAAPGYMIYSTVPGGKYAAFSGTSMAAPHVAGAAALVWSAHPEWTMTQVRDALIQTVDLQPSLSNKTITGGRINVNRAIQLQ